MPAAPKKRRASSPPTMASPTRPSAACSRILSAAKPNNSEPDSVTVLRLVSPAVLAVAVAHTRTIMEAPDAEDADGPLVHGWAVHAAFLLGALWQQHRERPRSSPQPGKEQPPVAPPAQCHSLTPVPLNGRKRALENGRHDAGVPRGEEEIPGNR